MYSPHCSIADFNICSWMISFFCMTQGSSYWRRKKAKTCVCVCDISVLPQQCVSSYMQPFRLNSAVNYAWFMLLACVLLQKFKREERSIARLLWVQLCSHVNLTSLVSTKLLLIYISLPEIRFKHENYQEVIGLYAKQKYFSSLIRKGHGKSKEVTLHFADMWEHLPKY